MFFCFGLRIMIDKNVFLPEIIKIILLKIFIYLASYTNSNYKVFLGGNI